MRILVVNVLAHLMLLVFFYNSWEHQKTFGFLMFLGGIERKQQYKMG